MCKNEKRTHGTAAKGVPVAEMLTSEARQPRTSGHVMSAYGDPSLCFSRAIDRESLAGLCNSLKIGLLDFVPDLFLYNVRLFPSYFS